MNKINLNIMNIYPEMLQENYGLCEEILKDYGYTEQDFFARFNQQLSENELQNLSNRLVDIMFDITEEMIKQKDTKADIEYYVNGSMDTHFYINGKEQ